MAQWLKSEQRKSLINGAPGEIRTPDLLVRSQALYPTELRAQRVIDNKTSTVELGHNPPLFRRRRPSTVRRMPTLQTACMSSVEARQGRIRGANITTSIGDDHSVAKELKCLGVFGPKPAFRGYLMPSLSLMHWANPERRGRRRFTSGWWIVGISHGRP